jgi:Ni,Fe-hydrogenase maturation factor
MDIKLVINAIKNIAPAASPIIHQAQRNETIIKVKKKLGLDPAQPPKDVDAVYAYALVEYGVDKPESILKFFRDKEVKTAFWKAFNDNFSAFVTDAEDFLDWNILGDEIREAKINLRPEFQQFYKVFVSVARRTRTPAEVIADSKFKALPEKSFYADEFKALIEEKIKTFCGRQFVFDEFNSFLKNHNKGYFTVIGEAGMGKSTIAAKYVYDHKAICYFNVLAEGRNKPEQFLRSIRQQLMNRYQLQNAENADLPTLLTKVSEKLAADERLVIVIDALDEVEQEPGAENLLYLPKTLPERIYFLLTRRLYAPNKKRLLTEGVEQEELDLTADKYAEENKKDVKEYISLFINDDPEHKDDLRKWIQNRHISPKEFIEQVAAKSENNFMYLRYVLPDIAKGLYQDLSIKELPNGLQEYYQQHWVRMEMENEPKKLMVIVLFILVEIGTAITCEMIAEIAEQDEIDVARVLDEWREYLKKQKIEEEICYSIYHASFVDFLKGKRELKSTRNIFDDVNRRIADYLY